MKVEGYKGFNRDFICIDKIYCPDATFTVEGELNLCENGMHFCECPIAVFSFYSPDNSRYAEVIATGEVVREDDTNTGPWRVTKCCTNELRVVREISAENMVCDSIHYMAVHWDIGIDKEHENELVKYELSVNKEQRAYSQSSTTIGIGLAPFNCVDTTSGSIAITRADLSVARVRKHWNTLAISIGNHSAALAEGSSSVAFAGGHGSVAIAEGECCIACVHYDSKATTKGAFSLVMADSVSSRVLMEGDWSVAMADGDVEVTGDNCIVILRALWRKSWIKAVKGTRLFLPIPPEGDVHSWWTDRVELVCGEDPEIWPADRKVEYQEIYEKWKLKCTT